MSRVGWLHCRTLTEGFDGLPCDAARQPLAKRLTKQASRKFDELDWLHEGQ